MEIIKSEDIWEEVAKSWEKCRNINLDPFINKPIVKLPDNVRDKFIEENKNTIDCFRNVIQEVGMEIRNYICILTDCFNIILNCYRDDNGPFCNSMFESGHSLNEDSFGTNAVLFANNIGKPIWFYPEHHYCYGLKTLSSFSIPIIIENNIIVNLSVMGKNQSLNKNIIRTASSMVKLLIYNLKKNDYWGETNSDIITNKQEYILHCLAEGYTEQAVAYKMGISVNTIRDHKKVIYKKLKVNSTCEAVVKAIKLGLLDINNIGVC